MSNHMSGNRDSVATDDEFAELAHDLGAGSKQAATALEAPDVGYEFDLEDELMRELGAASEPASFTGEANDADRLSLDHDAPPLAADVEDLPNMHLGAGRATRWSEQHYGLDSGFDAAAEDLESEFNALIGNTPRSEGTMDAVAAQSDDAYFDAEPAFESAAGNRVELVESPMSVDLSKFAETDSKVATDNPFEMLAAMASRYSQDPEFDAPVHAERHEPSFEPAPHAAAPRSQATPRYQVDAPSIDTVEINDRAYYAQDDLAIPAGYEDDQPVAARNVNDEIDDDFFDLLNQMSGEAKPKQATAGRDQYFAEDHGNEQAVVYQRATPQTTFAQPAAAPQASHPAYSDSYNVRPSQVGADDDFDLSEAFDDDMDFAGYDPTEPAAKPKRKLWGMAVIAGLAVVAAVGAYAMNMVGGGISGAPVLVQADNSPIKVRPANPGGATIPNQNSGVYDAVSGVNTASTTQKKLIDGAEKPIEMAENLPDNSDEMVAEGEEALGDAKSEDRIEQTAQADQPAADQAPKSSVTPKMVRTVTVKPDGSIEKPAPKKVAQKQEKAAAKPQVAAAEADESVEDVVAGNEKPAAVAKETTASIPTASGAWATQIASEGSEAAAKAAYKKLSAKYPSIGGKGVAIVKAEVSGATRYRVRIMSESKADAQSLCSGIKSKGGSCFVSKS